MEKNDETKKAEDDKVAAGEGESATAPAESSRATSLVERTEVAAKRAEEALAKNAAVLKEINEANAMQRLGGVTNGAPQKEAPKELTPEEYKDKVLANEIP